jgi:hypothetical protein
MNCCHETMKMDVPPGRRLWNADCGMRIENLRKSFERPKANSENRAVKFDIINLAKNPRSEIQNRSRDVLEQYVAGSDTRGRQASGSTPSRSGLRPGG